MLDSPAPTIGAYPIYSVVAEKFQSIVFLGMANSRMKDFFDLWTFQRSFSFDGSVLHAAIQATFDRRKTDLPTCEITALSEEFSDDPNKQVQWNAFMRKSNLDKIELSEVILRLREFLLPLIDALNFGDDFKKVWNGGGPWVELT